MNDQIAAQIGRANAFGNVHQQRPIRHREVVVVNVLFPFEDDFRHGVLGWRYA